MPEPHAWGKQFPLWPRHPGMSPAVVSEGRGKRRRTRIWSAEPRLPPSTAVRRIMRRTLCDAYGLRSTIATRLATTLVICCATNIGPLVVPISCFVKYFAATLATGLDTMSTSLATQFGHPLWPTSLALQLGHQSGPPDWPSIVGHQLQLLWATAAVIRLLLMKSPQGSTS